MDEGWEIPPISPQVYEPGSAGSAEHSPGWKDKYESLRDMDVRHTLKRVWDSTVLNPDTPPLSTIDPKIVSHGVHHSGSRTGSLINRSPALTGSTDLRRYSLASPGLRSATENKRLLAENQRLKDELQDTKQKYEQLQQGCDRLQRMLGEYERKAQKEESSESDSSDEEVAPPKATNRRRENIADRIKLIAAYRKSFSANFKFEREWTSPATNFTFHYNEHAELDPFTKFSTDQIMDYIQNHINFRTYAEFLYGGTRSTALTIWIQNHPADSGSRYPHKLSSKCRFTSCPVPNYTISKGEYRVCFDEWDWAGSDDKDPFHNAGYAHLFCIEEQIDFPWLCKTYNVRGDNRRFRKETSNKMAITRDYKQMLNLVEDYVRDSQPWPVGEPRPVDWFKDSLCKKLTDYHLDHQPRGRQNVRNNRAGVSLDRYLGDLRLKQRMAEDAKAEKHREGGHLPVTRSRSFSMPKENTRKRDTGARMGGWPATKRAKNKQGQDGDSAYFSSERQKEQSSLFEQHRLGKIG